MAKVRKMEKIETQMYFTRAEEELPVSKYAWMCLSCGRVWLMQGTAANCPHQDTVSYGSRTFPCIRRENPLKYARGREAYQAVQYEKFKELKTKPEDWVWNGRMVDRGPIKGQLVNLGSAALVACELCGFQPLRYVFYIETVEWLVDSEKREKLTKIIDYEGALSWAREFGGIDMEKFQEKEGIGTVFRFDGRHELGIGSECITNHMLATPLLKERFEVVKKTIADAQRDARKTREKEEFERQYPDVEDMLNELRTADEFLNMKFESKWESRYHKYMPSPIGVNKQTSIVYRMEKALKNRGYPTKALLKKFEHAWRNRAELVVEAAEAELERKRARDEEEKKLRERAGANKDVLDAVNRIRDEARYRPDRIRPHELRFVEDMEWRLRFHPDMRISEKQAGWVKSIEERMFGKELTDDQHIIHQKIGFKLAELGIRPSEWETEFLKTVAAFVSQGRELTPKMRKVWEKLFKGQADSMFEPKEVVQ